MPDLAAYQRRFAAGLLADAPIVLAEEMTRDPDWRDRFAVYRNNVMTALTDAIMSNHPTVERLVGAAFMRAAAAAFARAHPPLRPDLTLGGEGFADFLRAFPPARSLPYLADVAALDHAWLEVLFSENVPSLAPDALAELSPDAIAALAPGLAAGARVVSSPYPAYSIWVGNRESDGRAPVRLGAGGETALLWRARSARPGPSVRHRLLSPGEAVFTRTLLAGETLGAAGAAALAADPGFDIAAAFGGLLAAGALARPSKLDEAAP
jgi:hypothetical protein